MQNQLCMYFSIHFGVLHDAHSIKWAQVSQERLLMIYVRYALRP